ncbi:uncharacterized protein LOC143058421 [Mytilus galloprovincialis]|uniref:uncharacterized protein LOC143058421 n=1 Tax=Mytilus galloprovincialis TaxID=29158 RepID=UPI003F7BB071
MNYTPDKVYEGQSVTLCCCSESRTSTIEIWWTINSLVLSSRYNTNVLCHDIINVNRSKSGEYRCFAENEIGIVHDDVIVTVLYPPDIPDQHVNVTEKEVSRTLQCFAYGVPSKYTYSQWEHLSYFGEHIRYLNATTDGKVTLPQIANKIKRYQDNGIYICTVSNGVVDITGNSFQKGQICVIANGPPVFVEKTKYKQYSQQGQKLYLEFIVYTKSMIQSYNVKSDNKEIPALMQMTSVNSTTIFHGTEITVEAFGVVLSFNISNNSNSHVYTVTLCNVYGNNSFEVEIKLVTTEEKIINSTKVASITVLVVLVMCVPVLVAAVFLKLKRKRNRERRIVDDIPALVEGQPVPVENIVYQDAIAFRPRPLQASG